MQPSSANNSPAKSMQNTEHVSHTEAGTPDRGASTSRCPLYVQPPWSPSCRAPLTWYQQCNRSQHDCGLVLPAECNGAMLLPAGVYAADLAAVPVMLMLMLMLMLQ